ncbi:tyrosine-type recombinase/integrase [Jeotgalicoccus halotolerans]|uniref:tyrosine-type recombinase/integrase n=1 Tax=Jeotgalicoccus halotolerans TaxID=157227 RepID=UPI00351695E4
MKLIKSKKYPNVYSYENTTGKLFAYRLRYKDFSGKRREVKRLKFEEERDAYDAMIEMQYKINNNNFHPIKKEKQTIADFYKSHIDQNKPNERGIGNWSINTYQTNENIYRNYLLPLLGDIRLSDFNLEMYEKIYLKHLMSCRGVETIKTHHRYISSALNYAVKKKLIDENPIRYAELPKEISSDEDKFIDEDELNALLKIVSENESYTNKMMIYTLAFTGMRINEVRALKWKNINFVKNTIQVYNQMTHYTIGPTKGRKKRVIKVAPELIDMFKVYRKWCIERTFKNGESLTKDHYICLSPRTARLVQRDTCYQAIKRNAFKLGLEVSPHTLRHTHATILLMNGEPLESVARRLGNTVEVLLKHYSHVIPASEDRIVDNFSSKISFGAGSGANSKLTGF